MYNINQFYIMRRYKLLRIFIIINILTLLKMSFLQHRFLIMIIIPNYAQEKRVRRMPPFKLLITSVYQFSRDDLCVAENFPSPSRGRKSPGKISIGEKVAVRRRSREMVCTSISQCVRDSFPAKRTEGRKRILIGLSPIGKVSCRLIIILQTCS